MRRSRSRCAVESGTRRRALAAGRAEVDACERVLSRFDAGSDLSTLNGAGGEWVSADSASSRRCAGGAGARGDRRAVRPDDPAGARRRRLRPLVRAAHPARPAGRATLARPARAIEIDGGGGRARIEAGRRGRPGRDRQGLLGRPGSAGDACGMAGAPGALVDLGGDVAVWGASPDGGPWRIAVADPRAAGREPRVVRLAAAVSPHRAATGADSASGTTLHHLIDPSTGARRGAGRWRSRWSLPMRRGGGARDGPRGHGRGRGGVVHRVQAPPLCPARPA